MSFESGIGTFNRGPTSLQDTGSGARGAGVCEIDHAMPANAATAMPSLSKVNQRGASALVSTIGSVTHAVHYLGNKLAATPLSLSNNTTKNDNSHWVHNQCIKMRADAGK